MQTIQTNQTNVKSFSQFTKENYSGSITSNEVQLNKTAPLTYHTILFNFELKFKNYVRLCTEQKFEEASRQYEKALKELDNELREYASQQTGKFIICES